MQVAILSILFKACIKCGASLQCKSLLEIALDLDEDYLIRVNQAGLVLQNNHKIDVDDKASPSYPATQGDTRRVIQNHFEIEADQYSSISEISFFSQVLWFKFIWL